MYIYYEAVYYISVSIVMSFRSDSVQGYSGVIELSSTIDLALDAGVLTNCSLFTVIMEHDKDDTRMTQG